MSVNPIKLPRGEFWPLLKSASLGVFFWLVFAVAALIVHGPIKPIHEW
jgi:hypothetical protein